jgi:hypothetical protein
MNPTITKLIDQYLSGELSPEDRKIFEDRLNNSTELQQEVTLQKTIVEGVKRASQRTEIQKISRHYKFKKTLKALSIATSIIALAVVSTYFIVTNKSEIKQNTVAQNKIPETLINTLEKSIQLDNLTAQYFSIPEEGNVVLSKKGVLLSIPKNAFLQNGKPYSGATIVQFQEALDGADIVKSGLSTMSGDRLLETQGMIALQGFTADGKPLEINPKVGVYVQVPVDEYKKDMQLFDGVKLANGVIDWQNPTPLEKIPVPVDMSELDFYPGKYEPKLNDIKWNKSKKSRDSLYLSFEQEIESSKSNNGQPIRVPSRNITVEESKYLYSQNRPIDRNMSIEEAYALMQWKEGPNWGKDFNINGRHGYTTDSISEFATAGAVNTCNYIPPSKVLAFWNKKFNNTNLATREFERRMQSIHATCDERVLLKYINNLRKPISQVDKEVAQLGYSEFQKYASENVGAVNPNNPHIKGLKAFYDMGIAELKADNQKNQKTEQNRRSKWDNETRKERTVEQLKTVKRESAVFKEEYKLNLNNVYKQLGYVKGFIITGTRSPRTGVNRGAVIKNIDAYVREATITRTTTEITDPLTGKKAKITYNDFSFEVPNASKYVKLYAYLFPHELNNYQRIDGKNGKFNYPLNDFIIYDMAVIGITENGYEIFEKTAFKNGLLGAVSMSGISEKELGNRMEQMNKARISYPAKIKDEFNWLVREKADYKEQKMRKEMSAFRIDIGRTLFPCLNESTEQIIVKKTKSQANLYNLGI